MYKKLIFLLLIAVLTAAAASAQPSEFTYQGKLTDSSLAPTGTYDFEFRLCELDPNGGCVPLETRQRLGVPVTNGIFTVNLDFSTPYFNGENTFLEISVRRTSSDPWTPLNPRQKITSAPYAIKSQKSSVANYAFNSERLGGLLDTGFIKNSTSQQTADFNISGNGIIGGNVGIGTTAQQRLSVADGMNIDQSNLNNGTVTNTLRFGSNSGEAIGSRRQAGTNQFGLDFYTNSLNRMAITLNGNVGIGTPAPASRLHLNGNSSNFALTFTNGANMVGKRGYRIAFDNDRLSFQRADDSGNFVENQISIDQGTGRVGIGTLVTSSKLSVNAGFSDGLQVTTALVGGKVAEFGSIGEFHINSFDVPGGRLKVLQSGAVLINNPPLDSSLPVNTFQALHVNGVIRTGLAPVGGALLCYSINQEIAACGSSIRYKEKVRDFSPGLALVRRLRPVSFNWKQGGMADLGLTAEEVAQVEPLLATYDSKGEIQGVKYDRLGVVLINAFKEQQSQIEAQKREIEGQRRLAESQQRRIETLEKLVCELKRQAAICKEKQK